MDSGVALPTAALPYNEMVITFTLRDWNELLIAESPSSNTPNTEYRHIPTMNDIVGTVEPELTSVQVWANYAIVSNDVIEHIYDVDGFLGKLHSLSDGALSVVMATDANKYNSRIRNSLMLRQRKIENEDREKEWGPKARDSLTS